MKKLLLLLSVFMMPTTYGMARLRSLTAQASVYAPALGQQHVKPSTVRTFATKAAEELKTAKRFPFVPKTTVGKIGAGLAVAVAGTVAGAMYLDARPEYIASLISNSAFLLNQPILIQRLCDDWYAREILVEGVAAHCKHVSVESMRYIASHCSLDHKARIVEAIKDDIRLLNDAELVKELLPCAWQKDIGIENILAESVITHFEHMNINSMRLIVHECSSNNKIRIAEAIKDNINILNDVELVEELFAVYSYPNQREEVGDILVESVIARSQYINIDSMRRIVRHCSSGNKVRIAEAIKDNINLLNDTELVKALCSSILYPKAADILAKSIVAYAQNMTNDAVILFIGLSTTNIDLKNELFAIIQKKLTCEKSEAPSCTHIKQAGQDIKTMLKNHSHQMRRALQKEPQLHKEGLHCFYHGQESKWGLQQDLTHDIVVGLQQRGIVQDALPEDFRYIMNKTVLLDKEIDEQPMMARELQRHHAIYKGSTLLGGGAARTGLLFVNKFAHGRVQQSGSYTAEYVISNRNVISNQLDFQSVFSALTIPELHEKYKEELAALEVMHKQLFTSGRLLQICIPSAIVDNVVRMKYGGVKTKKKKQIKTITSFIDTVQREPDAIEFRNMDKASEMVIPLTSAYLLNPHSGIKIFAYDAEPTDAELHATYVARRKALAEKIALDAAQQLQGKKFTLCCKTAAARLKEAAQALGK